MLEVLGKKIHLCYKFYVLILGTYAFVTSILPTVSFTLPHDPQ